MSLLDRLLGRNADKPAIALEAIDRVAQLVGQVIDGVRDRDEARQRLARLARAGDLDFLIDAVELDRKRALAFTKAGRKTTKP